MTKIAACIPTAEGRETLLEPCLKALERWPQVTAYVGQAGFFTENMNSTLEAAYRGGIPDFVWMLNDDTLPLEGCLERSLEFFEQFPACGAVGHRNMDYEDHSKTNYAGPPPETFYPPKGWMPQSLNDARVVPWYAFSSFMIRGEVVAAIGLLNKWFEHTRSDCEYCIRMRAAGWDICYLPTAEVAHKWHTPPKVQGKLSEVAIRDDEKFHAYLQGLVGHHIAQIGARPRTERIGELTALAERYGTDKGYVADRLGRIGHHYTPTYERLLGPRRLEVQQVLEIGVERGASLQMWADYFPNAVIWGIDNDPTCLNENANGRIRMRLINQAETDELTGFASISGPFDLIVDDGSHIDRHQQVSLAALFPVYLKPGGFYAIEDIGELQRRADPRYEASDPSTLEMLKRWLAGGEIESQHMDQATRRYIAANIADLTSNEDNTLCILEKVSV